jgi:hypothetical protein
VVAILKMETGRNFSMSGINSGRWNRTMLNLCGIVAAILKMATGRNFSMLGIYPHMKCRWNRTMLNLCGIVVAILKMATGRNFSMSGIIRDIIIYPHIKWSWICAVLWWPFWKWRPVEFFRCQGSIRDIIIYPHIKFWWY